MAPRAFSFYIQLLSSFYVTFMSNLHLTKSTLDIKPEMEILTHSLYNYRKKKNKKKKRERERKDGITEDFFIIT